MESPKDQTDQKPASDLVPSEVQHVTAHRAGVQPPPTFTAQSTSRNFGCLIPLGLWTLGWILVAGVAIHRFGHFPDFSAFLAAMISGLVSILALRVWLAISRGRNAFLLQSFGNPAPFLQRFRGWFAALIWSGIGLFWNVGIFDLLVKAANRGEGWLILFMTILSLVGLVLLFVVYTCISLFIAGLGSRDISPR
jgi:hypothetical protein